MYETFYGQCPRSGMIHYSASTQNLSTITHHSESLASLLIVYDNALQFLLRLISQKRNSLWPSDKTKFGKIDKGMTNDSQRCFLSLNATAERMSFCLSVCLLVRLSDALVQCGEIAKHIITLFRNLL